jgi:hypothetical protein
MRRAHSQRFTSWVLRRLSCAPLGISHGTTPAGGMAGKASTRSHAPAIYCLDVQGRADRFSTVIDHWQMVC